VTHAEELYRDYWKGEATQRQHRAYYDRLYKHLAGKIKAPKSWNKLDIAGGSGEVLRYFGIQNADILDISDSGLEQAKTYGYRTVKGDVEKRFPFDENTYDAAFCFEVLEHLRYPNRTLAEINHVLKPGGIFYVAQPNMRPDGVYHVRRYSLQELIDDLQKSGFEILWKDYVPAYSVRDAILSDIRKNPSWIRKGIQCVNLALSLLPRPMRYAMAKLYPNRFALIFMIKAKKVMGS
jgi:SAM-dependent methyltransferase